MKIINIFLLAIIAIQITTSCQNRQSGQIQQVEESPYYHWVCPQGDHQGAEITFIRTGNAFRGEYTDPGFHKHVGIPIMGAIDDKGIVTGVSAVMPEGDIKGKLSGKITGDKFSAIWLPTPTGMEISEYREMELVINTSGEQKNFEPPSPPQIILSEKSYGYVIGEQENKFIHIAQGTKNDEVNFHLHNEESGLNDIIIDVQGAAQLNGDSFRYKEKDYEFEITVYNGFITLTTISGELDGYKADGIYPEITINDSYLVN